MSDSPRENIKLRDKPDYLLSSSSSVFASLRSVSKPRCRARLVVARSSQAFALIFCASAMRDTKRYDEAHAML